MRFLGSALLLAAVWLFCSQTVILWAYRYFREEGEDFRRSLCIYLLGSGVFPLSVLLFLVYLVLPSRSPFFYLSLCLAVFAALAAPVLPYAKTLMADYRFALRSLRSFAAAPWTDKLLAASVALVALICVAMARLPIVEHDALTQSKQAEIVFDRSNVAITYAQGADPETSFLTLGYGNGTTMTWVLAFTLGLPTGSDVAIRSIGLIAALFLVILWGRFVREATGRDGATLIFAALLFLCPQMPYLLATQQKEPLLFLMYGTGGAIILSLARQGRWKRYWPFIAAWWGICAHFYFPGSVIFFSGIALWLIFADTERQAAFKALAIAGAIGTVAAVAISSLLPLAFGQPFAIFLQPMRNYSGWVQRHGWLLHYFGRYPKYGSYFLAATDSKLNVLRASHYGPIAFALIPLAIWMVASRRRREETALCALAMAVLVGTFITTDPLWLEFILVKNILQFFWHTKYWIQVYVLGAVIVTWQLCRIPAGSGYARLAAALLALAPLAFWPFDRTERFDRSGFDVLSQLLQCSFAPREEMERLRREMASAGLSKRFDPDDATYWEWVKKGEKTGKYWTCYMLCAMVDAHLSEGKRTCVLSDVAPINWYYFKSRAMRTGDPRLDPIYDMNNPAKAAEFLCENLGITHIIRAIDHENTNNITFYYSVMEQVVADRSLCRAIAATKNHVLFELLPAREEKKAPSQ